MVLLFTHWDLHTEKPQSKFPFANRCEPIKCRVSLFPHVKKAIRPIRSPHIVFFHVWAVRQVEVGTVSFRFVSFLLIFKAKVVSLKQKGVGKEFELRSQTPTKQLWTQISQLYFISFGFYLSSFAFYEAKWLLFDHICLNKTCHNLRRGVQSEYVYNKHNTTWKVLCTVFTHSLFCITNLTRSLRSLAWFPIRHNSRLNTVRAHFPWSILNIFYMRSWQVFETKSPLRVCK